MTLNTLQTKHWRVYHREKKQWFSIIKPCLFLADLPHPLPHPISIDITQYSSRIRDVDNCIVAVKYLNDVLVECEYLKDDTPKYIESITLHSAKCAKAADDEVVVEITTPTT